MGSIYVGPGWFNGKKTSNGAQKPRTAQRKSHRINVKELP